jgi:23S rRNA (adenine2503-C2)-methyltransferase
VNAPWGFGFGARRVTISTSGVVPKILKLAEEPLGFRLAISLHGATNEVRNQIMPVNKKFPLEELIPAAKAFARKHGRMLTLEFILIEDINDSLEQAKKLAVIARELHAHVNLIPYNKVEGLPWVRPSLTRQDRFVKELRALGVTATLRREKGHDIDAACGQLRLQTEKAQSANPPPAAA